MRYYSTNKQAPLATLHEAVVKGLAGDRGLYMPETIKHLPPSFFDTIDQLSFQEIAFTVAEAFFGEDVPTSDLRHIVYDTLSFDCPVVDVLVREKFFKAHYGFRVLYVFPFPSVGH